MEPQASAERGDPAVDQRAYRRCLSQFGTGVTVITAQAGGERAGVTVNSFASLSLDPPLVTWALKRDARSRDVFTRAGHFAINILAQDQIGLSRAFATPAQDKFAHVRWTPGEDGAPLVEGVLATLECETHGVHEEGDHLLVIGRVRRFCRFERAPLLFVQGRYGVAADHPGLKEAPAGDGAALVAPGTSLMVLLLHAYQALSQRFEDRRRQVGMSLPQSRVLAVLQQHPDGLRPAALAARTYLGARDAEDAVAALRERGCVLQSADRLVLAPQGRAAREAILRHLQDFDLEQMDSFAPAEVEAARKVLAHLIHANAPRT